MNKKAFIKNKIFIGRIILSGICLLFLATTFHTESRSSGWYQQFLPNLNGASITDITFTDSLNGYAVTLSPAYILKTTNGGDNWYIIYNHPNAFYRTQFFNKDSGYVLSINQLLKTTNSGINWTIITLPDLFPEDIFGINFDTIWAVTHESLAGGVFRTTNGGLNWTQQFAAGTENPNKIYMYNVRIGFIVNNNNGIYALRKTTNGGNNWNIVAQNERFYTMYFSDSLTGWKSNGELDSSMKKTINGGLNWVKQNLPKGGYIGTTDGITRFSNVNKDTLWGIGNFIVYPNGQVRPMLYRTTNGGNNWHYQVPDTSIVHLMGQYSYINFINKNIGWAYDITYPGIHTVTGGDSLFYMGIQKISNEIPNDYILLQNYPNPFNPRTVIGYEIKKAGNIKLDVFDILGKEVMVLVNEKQSAGKYEVDYMGKFSPSGIYFYRLMAEGKTIDTKKMLLVK